MFLTSGSTIDLLMWLGGFKYKNTKMLSMNRRVSTALCTSTPKSPTSQCSREGATGRHCPPFLRHTPCHVLEPQFLAISRAGVESLGEMRSVRVQQCGGVDECVTCSLLCAEIHLQ